MPDEASMPEQESPDQTQDTQETRLAAGRRRFRKAAPHQIAAPTLGYIAVGSRSPAPALAEAGGSAATAYAQALQRLQAANTGQLFLITEAVAGTGAGAAALNLALTATAEGLRAVLIDADPSGNGATRYLRTGTGPGLADLAAGTAGLRQASRLLTMPDGRRLPVIPRGTGRPLGDVGPADLAEAVDKITEHSDLVLIFVPAEARAAWLSSLGAHADGAILSIDGRESTKTISAIDERLEQSGAPIVGVIEFAPRRRRRRG